MSASSVCTSGCDREVNLDVIDFVAKIKQLCVCVCVRAHVTEETGPLEFFNHRANINGGRSSDRTSALQ